MVREIPLTQGFVALVDDADFDRVMQFKWHVSKSLRTSYARHTYGHRNGQTSLHRFVLNAYPGIQVDHRNGDGLNCTRANLRTATSHQNKMNQRLSVANRSGFKGVYWRSSGNRERRWWAGITINGVGKCLGYFKTKEEAGMAYDEAARSYFGEFARLNFPNEGEQAA